MTKLPQNISTGYRKRFMMRIESACFLMDLDDTMDFSAVVARVREDLEKIPARWARQVAMKGYCVTAPLNRQKIAEAIVTAIHEQRKKGE